MAKMTDVVGHADCVECGFKNAPVFKNKRGKLVLVCPKAGGCNCMYTYQSEIAQARLKKRTTFISENPAPAVPVSETPVPEKVEPQAPEVQEIPETVVPVIPEKASEPSPDKKRFSFFNK